MEILFNKAYRISWIQAPSKTNESHFGWENTISQKKEKPLQWAEKPDPAANSESDWLTCTGQEYARWHCRRSWLLLAASCRPFPPPLSTSPSRSFLSSQEQGVVAVVRYRTASECVMSSFILTPVYRWLQAQHDSLPQPNPPPPSDASFLDENENLLDVKHHSATKLSLICAGFLDENDDLWDEYASC